MNTQQSVAGRLARRLAFALALTTATCSAGTLTMDVSRVAGGGGTVAAGNFSLSSTLGQAEANRAVTAGNYVLMGGFWSLFGPGPVLPSLTGPSYPPPLGVNFSPSGDAGFGGATWTFSNVALADYDTVYWGVTNSGIVISFFHNWNDILQYSPTQSSPSTGLLVWTGSAFLSGYYASGMVQTRCRMIISNPALLVDANSVGLPPYLGEAVRVGSSSASWTAQIFMEASWDGVNWQSPANLYNNAGGGINGQAELTSFSAGFYYANRPPAVSPVPNLLVTPGVMAGPVNFSISDIETYASNLVLSASSDAPAVLLNNQIQVVNTNGSCTLTLTTITNVAGVAHVTLHVQDTDGGFSNRVVTVTSDSPPLLSGLGPVSGPRNQPIGPVPFTVGDYETSPGSLTLSALSSAPGLVPPGNISFGGSGANRSLTITPVANVSGTAQLSVIVSDGLLQTTNVFTATFYAPFQITSASMNGQGQLLLTFTGVPGSTNSIVSTTDLNTPLKNWLYLGTATEVSPGNFQFLDTSAPLIPKRFYRIRSP